MHWLVLLKLEIFATVIRSGEEISTLSLYNSNDIEGLRVLIHTFITRIVFYCSCVPSFPPLRS